MNIGITVYPTPTAVAALLDPNSARNSLARGHTVHFISSALPTRLTELNERVRFHEVEMMSYPLFEHQPYTLALATKMATVAEEENLDLLHVHYAIPHSISAILARESLKPRRLARCDNAARNGHHARRRGSIVSADHALWHCAV